MTSKSTAAEVSSTGVDFGKVDHAILAKHSKAVGLVTAGLSLAEMVNQMQQYNMQEHKRSQLGKCSICHAIGDMEMVCVFCGDEGAPEDEDGSAEDESEVEPEKAAETVVASKPAKEVKPAKESKATKLKLVEATLPESVAKESMIDRAKVVLSEKSLDAATSRIIELQVHAVHTYWEIGRELEIVHSSDLWKARMDGKKVAYKSFNQYVVKELKMSPDTVFNMIDIAKKFSEKEVEKIGRTKLTWILKAPEVTQAKLLKKADAGASVSEIKKEVEAAKIKHGTVGEKRDTGRKKTPMGKPGKISKADAAKGVTKTTPVTESKVTIALSFETAKLPLWAKEKLKAGAQPSKVAKRLADEPFAIEQLTNGVVRYYSIMAKADGSLQLKIETKRKS